MTPPGESDIRRWLVFDVGCIECGEDSSVVGTYPTEEEAEAAAAGWVTDPHPSWGRPEWHGQHQVRVFDLLSPLDKGDSP